MDQTVSHGQKSISHCIRNGVTPGSLKPVACRSNSHPSQGIGLLFDDAEEFFAGFVRLWEAWKAIDKLTDERIKERNEQNGEAMVERVLILLSGTGPFLYPSGTLTWGLAPRRCSVWFPRHGLLESRSGPAADRYSAWRRILQGCLWRALLFFHRSSSVARMLLIAPPPFCVDAVEASGGVR